MSQSLKERINQVNRQNELKAAAEVQRHQDDERKMIEEETRKRQQEMALQAAKLEISKQEEEVRLRELHKAQTVFRESGVLKILKEIERKIPRGIRHNLIVRNEHTVAELVWGDKYSIDDQGNITYQADPSGKGRHLDCSKIQVTAAWTGQMNINYHQIPRGEWEDNPRVLEDASVHCYGCPIKRNKSIILGESESLVNNLW